MMNVFVLGHACTELLASCADNKVLSSVDILNRTCRLQVKKAEIFECIEEDARFILDVHGSDFWQYCLYPYPSLLTW
jgi:hypothetical protein